jgi:DNA-binding beta-propeller fold protein YncE
VVDLSSYRVIDFFPVALNDAPTFMTITPDGQGAFLLDDSSGYLSRIDLNTGRSVARVHLGYRPKYALYLAEQNLLAVSLSLSQKVLLLDPLRLGILGTISTGSTPQGMAVSENQLYIAEQGGNSVLITGLDNGGNQSRVTVGFGPRRLVVTGNQIYASNYDDGSLSVLLSGQEGVVIREMYGLGKPQEMAVDNFFRRLYVTDEEAAGLVVVDTNSNELVGRIILGARPLGLGVIQ